VGIGLFLSFIGLNETGIVRLGVEGAPVHVGDFTNRPYCSRFSDSFSSDFW